MAGGDVLVQVIADRTEAGREIGFGAPNVAELLDRRVDDIKRAVASGAAAVAASLPGLAAASGWELHEVGASFGVTLTAEAGALISKASAEATFEVRVTFTRERARGAGSGPDPQ